MIPGIRLATSGRALVLAGALLLPLPPPAQGAGLSPVRAPDEGGKAFTAGLSLERVSGTAFERVWVDDYRLSELKWEFDGLWMAGVEGSIALNRRFRLEGGAWAGLNEGDARMVDRDWAYFGPAGELVTSPGVDDDAWTHRSIHSNTTVDRAYVFDVSLGALLIEAGPFSLGGILGYRHERFEWSARGGDYVYSTEAPALFRDDAGSLPGDLLLIRYGQSYDIPYLGVGAAGRLGPLLLEVSLHYSPWTLARDEDFHVQLETLFEGEFSGGDYLAAGLSGTAALGPASYFRLAFDYREVAEQRGDAAITFPGQDPVVDRGGASVEMSAFSFSLSFGRRFSSGGRLPGAP